MRNRGIGLRAPLSLIGPTTLLATGAAGALWCWMAGDSLTFRLVAAGLLAVTGIAALLWRWRSRENKRLRAVFDAYAEREAVRNWRRHAGRIRPESGRPVSETATVSP